MCVAVLCGAAAIVHYATVGDGTGSYVLPDALRYDVEHATTILTDIPFEWNNPISFDTEGRTEGKVCGVRLGWLPEGMGTGGTATAYDSVTAQDPAQAELLTQEERDLVEYTYNFYTVRGEQKEYSIQCMSADEVAGCDFLCGGSRTEITKQGTIGPYDASWVETHWKNSNQDAGEPEEQSMQLLLLYDREKLCVVVISAEDIISSKVRGDYGITYDLDVLRLIDAFQEMGLYVGSVCVTKYTAAAEVEAFEKRLSSLGIRTFRHYKIPGYPNDVARIVSDEGYGRNEYIETERPLVVITAPGPGSGKMAVCLSQLYHEYKRGVKAGYAKFETFPIWNIPLKHPVNLAYEAATADLNDVNMIDPFHLEAYGVTTVNYNRDIEIFPVVNAMFELIAGQSPYKSPTDMGVNMAGNCIVDDAVCCEASRKEIVRRYYKCLCEQKITGTAKESERYKLELLMNQAGLTMGAREVEKQAHARSEATGGAPAAAIELSDGTVITGKTGPLLGATASALINALKYLAGIPQETDLVSAAAIEPIQTLKTNYLGGKNPRLHTDEILIALSSSAASSELAAAAMHQLPNLKGCDVHSTVLLSSVDSSTLNRLGMYLTCDPVYEEEDRKYHKL